jgi:hypothetical protein
MSAPSYEHVPVAQNVYLQRKWDIQIMQFKDTLRRR